MKDIAIELGVTTSLLRYWCNKLGFLCKRNNKGARVFTGEDKGVLIVAQNLMQKRLFTIEGARIELNKMNLKIYHPTI